MPVVAWIIASVLMAIAAMHVYWAAGGRYGAVAAVPSENGRQLFTPRKGGTLVVAALLLLAALLVLDRSHVISPLLPPALSRWGSWGVAAVLTARAIGEFNYIGFFKRRRETTFAQLDTRIFSPIALCLGIGAAVVAYGG